LKESPIFVKTFELIKWLFERTEKFPKSQRFFLAKRINDNILDFYELLIKAAINKKRAESTLIAADILLTRLRHYIRLAVEMKFLSFRQYEHVSKMISEIGNLLGGWLKTYGHGKISK